MKIHKTITLDVDIDKKLKQEINASATINNLLREYFQNCKSEEQILEETHALIKAKEEEAGNKKEFEAKLKKRTEEMKQSKQKHISFEDPREKEVPKDVVEEKSEQEIRDSQIDTF